MHAPGSDSVVTHCAILWSKDFYINGQLLLDVQINNTAVFSETSSFYFEAVASNILLLLLFSEQTFPHASLCLSIKHIPDLEKHYMPQCSDVSK